MQATTQKPGLEDDEDLLAVAEMSAANLLLAELADEMIPPIDIEHEITVGMLADKTGRSARNIKAELDDMVTGGRLVCRTVMCNGHKATAYRKA